MRARNALLMAVLLASLTGWSAGADTYRQKPSELAAYFKAQNPFGSGPLHFLWMHPYDGALWTDAPRWSFEKPFALTLFYRTRFSKDELAETSVKEMKRLSELPPETLQKAGKKLEAIFPSVKAGDRISAVYLPPETLHFYYNGTRTGTLTGRELIEPFVGIWLSEDSRIPEFRDAMLGRSQ